jgi:hypothetical protein
MNLPYSPTFFRKMDIYQQLKEYEGQKDKKRLWEGEKALLIWAGSEHHQHLGSAIDTHHVKDALDFCVKEHFITDTERERIKGSLRHILESLPTHEFGEVFDNTNPKEPRIKINRNGILAGQILLETKNLKKTYKYYRWNLEWYFLYYIAGSILIIQMVKGLIELIILLYKK